MNYLSCIDAAKKLGVSTRRIQQMCKQGEISNAIKDGRTWLIPDDITLKQLKPLPIGVSDFKSATTNYYYVDKTLMIRDFLDAKPMVSLFTRPRRFGKTLNMDMLRVFFEKQQKILLSILKTSRYGDVESITQNIKDNILLSFSLSKM